MDWKTCLDVQPCPQEVSQADFTMGPSDCDECESPNIQYNWVNRLYTGFCALCMVKSRNGIHDVCLCLALSA